MWQFLFRTILFLTSVMSWMSPGTSSDLCHRVHALWLATLRAGLCRCASHLQVIWEEEPRRYAFLSRVLPHHPSILTLKSSRRSASSIRGQRMVTSYSSFLMVLTPLEALMRQQFFIQLTWIGRLRKQSGAA